MLSWFNQHQSQQQLFASRLMHHFILVLREPTWSSFEVIHKSEISNHMQNECPPSLIFSTSFVIFIALHNVLSKPPLGNQHPSLQPCSAMFLALPLPSWKVSFESFTALSGTITSVAYSVLGGIFEFAAAHPYVFTVIIMVQIACLYNMVMDVIQITNGILTAFTVIVSLAFRGMVLCGLFAMGAVQWLGQITGIIGKQKSKHIASHWQPVQKVWTLVGIRHHQQSTATHILIWLKWYLKWYLKFRHRHTRLWPFI